MASKADLKRQAAISEALSPFGFPAAAGTVRCFDEAGAALMRRGWPNLRRLTDEPASGAAADATLALAFDSRERVLGFDVPRERARRYLLGYAVGPTVPDVRPADTLAARRAARMASDQAVDLALLEETFAAHARGMGDFYAFRWPEVLYLYEAFLGSEAVARATVAMLCQRAGSASAYGEEFWAKRHHDGGCLFNVGVGLAWMLERVPQPARGELRAQLGRAPDPTTSEAEPWVYFSMLRALATGRPAEGWKVPIAFASGDVDEIERILGWGGHEFIWNLGRVCWSVGTARLAGPLQLAAHDTPALVAQLSPLKDAGVVRVFAYLVSQGRAKKLAGQWLLEHASFTRPVLEALAAVDDAKEQKVMAAALALFGAGATPADDAPLDAAGLEAAVAALFSALGKTLGATRAKARQKKALREAYEAYVALRVRAREVAPEEFFIQRFEDFGLGAFAQAAVDALD